jgi:hypothetical protein
VDELECIGGAWCEGGGAVVCIGADMSVVWVGVGWVMVNFVRITSLYTALLHSCAKGVAKASQSFFSLKMGPFFETVVWACRHA